ncbi:MAG: hypothetical protein QGH66_06415 [Dehalococcoidia bacterium]|nr:hypothetical protein [Dehalococcoidia bacterium]
MAVQSLYSTNITRHFSRYGAICIGSQLYSTESGGLFNANDDGSWDICPMPREMGLPATSYQTACVNSSDLNHGEAIS